MTLCSACPIWSRCLKAASPALTTLEPEILAPISAMLVMKKRRVSVLSSEGDTGAASKNVQRMR